jgi:DNA-binding NarL/FixJ family response regulator
MRVLLADDLPSLRSALRLLLEHEVNVEVVGEATHTGSIAPLVDRLHPDLLLLDWELSGLETISAHRQLLDNVRAINPQLYVVALTNDDGAAGRGLYGDTTFVSRSDSPRHIVTAVQQAMKSQLAAHTRNANNTLLQ